ncbi:hypothetical protein CR513_59090, partial [Mucuna pruriens]
MATFDDSIAYTFISKIEKKNNDGNHNSNDSYDAETKPPSPEDEFSFQFPVGAENLFDGGCELSDDSIVKVSPVTNMLTEMNMKNALAEAFAIFTGRNNTPRITDNRGCDSSDVWFHGSENNEDYVIDPSVYLPSAPPIFDLNGFEVGVGVDSGAYKEVLEAEPPEWLPDSYTTVCMHCSAPFTALTRGRHHCRFCGRIFCRACTRGRCLLPVRFRERSPQRVCDACFNRLDPLQVVLLNTISNAVQVAKHDVMNWTCARGWLNLPIGLSMEHEIYKSSNALRSYCQVARSNPERSIPLAILSGAKGLAILTVAKAGAVLSYKLGTGLVVARRSDGSWSAPSAIFSLGLGWGAQIGGELVDFIIVLHDMKAVKTFCSRMHISLGAGCSAAAGPLGRVLEADIRAGDGGSGICYTYSCSK